MSGLTYRQKRRLYPTVCCYHGCVSHRAAVLTFREHVADIQSHVRSLQAAGYLFLLPSQYKAWQQGLATYDRPVTCLHFDDCLGSINLIVPWLIEQGIACGLAVITRRLGKYDSEDGFARWEWVRDWIATGLVELMSHTHNMHHLTLIESGGAVDVAPVLEAPCWIDDGDVVYRAAGDTRWYWDFSHVDYITLGVPLFGTDPYDGTTPVVTTLTVTPKVSGTVELLRLWMALSKPSGAGYDAQVQIRADGLLVWDGTIEPKNYETRSQWVEREFYSITLDTSFAVAAGVAVELEFTTLNAGAGVALLYGLTTANDTAFRAVTSCQGLFAEGSQGQPNRYWQYIDYPADDRWPVVPCLILGFGTGAPATVEQYQGYVEEDCLAARQSVDNYLNATWTETRVWTATTLWWYWETQQFFTAAQDPNPAWPTFGDYVPIGWNAPSKIAGVVPLSSPSTITVEWVRVDLTRPESFLGGDANPFGPGALDGNPVGRAAIYEAENRSYPATFQLFVGNSSSGPWEYIGDAAIWRLARNQVIDVTPFVLTAGVTRYLRVAPINGGPTVGTERRTRWGMRTVTAGSRAATAYAGAFDQLVYPFGGYYAEGAGAIQQQPGFKDINADLKTILAANGLTHGYTIQAIRNVADGEVREPDLRQTEYALGRWLIYGDQAPAVSLNNLQAYSGYLFQDVKHRGVAWQASMEADPLGNATARARAAVLDYVAFDAWAFDGEGGLVAYPINDGGTYSGTPYADDKGWLQARGVRCLLIINNNLGTGEPDADIGSHVVNNPATYVPLIVAAAVDNGWDGITCNIEAVPAADRAAATTFYRQLARAMHAAGKLLHATVPAATGTDYDAEFWTGWCDHGEIVKVCDAIKVMSYTETGPGTAPGPAAPTAFWNAVYARMRAVIPEPYWPRVLCGCRSFGHRWDVAAGTADFITYHQGIAGALTYGKRVDVRDTEAGWGTDNIKVWFGTPATVDRAQREAAESFGGIGLWKLDDGDIEEFFPAHKQIGRVEGMDFMDVRFPTKISIGSSGGPRFSTSVVPVQSGDEARNARWTMPLHDYDASMAVTDRELFAQVRDLFMVARGRWRSFRYKDFSDYQAIGQVIGTADGVLTNFQLRKEYVVGAEELVRTITKPVAATVVIYRNGVAVPGTDWTINPLTGLISFTAAPAAGVISADFEFDVPVRFDTDSLPTELLARSGDELLLSPGTIPLVEVRV